MDIKGVPPGRYVGIRPELIDQGQMLARFGDKLQDTFKQLDAIWRDNGVRKGKAKVQLEITIGPSDLGENEVDVVYAVKHALPATMPKRSIAKAGGGKLLVQPQGSSSSAPDQQVMDFYDQQGARKGAVDAATGEPIKDEDDAVAGEINAG